MAVPSLKHGVSERAWEKGTTLKIQTGVNNGFAIVDDDTRVSLWIDLRRLEGITARINKVEYY